MAFPLRAAPLTPRRVAAAAAFVTAVATFLGGSDEGSRSPFARHRSRVPAELRAPLLVLSLTCAAFLLFVAPIPQDKSYHAFADRRGFRCGCGLAGGGFIRQDAGGGRGFMIPNFLDVASNLVILGGGLAGLALLALKDGEGGLDLVGNEWQLTVCLPVFFGGTAAVSVGSAYYHWRPDNATLVFDRLPMTVAFMAVFAFLVDERLSFQKDPDENNGRRIGPLILAPLLVLGTASVLYWHVTDDLRPYALVQFTPLLAVPVLLALYPPTYSGQEHLVAALFWYVVAKVCENKDYEIYNATGRRVSGHTLKHVTAGVVPFCIEYMLLVRKRLPEDRALK